MKRRLALGAIASVAILSACGATSTRGTIDSPVEPLSQQNNGPAHIINMPDGFMNVAFKCDGHNGIYAHTRAAAPVIVPNDPNCVK